MKLLTKRELKILRLYSSGLRKREIARSVGTPHCGVVNSMTNAVRKTGARDRIQLLCWFSCELFQIGLEELHNRGEL